MKLLLISNSTNAGEPYLQYPLPEIARFLKGVREVVFVPYAAVTFSYAEYERRVAARFAELGIRLRSVHRAADAAHMIRHAEAVCVGGGNTFALTKKMQEQGLMKALLARIRGGMPYVGWSAGSNVCCPTIRTTNDMPIVEPESFRAIGAVKFQINPHYLDANPAVGFPEGVKKRVQPVPFQQQALFHQTAQFPFREPFGLEPGQIFLGDVHQRTSLGRVFGRTVHAERDMGLRDFLHQFSQIFRIWYFRIVHRFCRINGCRHSASLSGVSRGSRWPA